MTCSYSDCERPVRANGLCNAHMLRQKRGQAMDTPIRVPLSPAERFWNKVNKTGPVPAHRPELGNCWLWAGAVSVTAVGGYGSFWTGERYEKAHRFSFILANGRPPVVTDHVCRNTLCVRPLHLEDVGTQDNVTRGHEYRRVMGIPDSHRKDLCKRGHPMAGPGSNVYETKNGRRHCRTCIQMRRQKPSKTREPQAICKRGHPLIGPEADVYVYRGRKGCRRCANERAHRRASAK